MTFRDFKAQVNALPAHDLASVPCDGVELDGCDVALPGTGDPERIEELEDSLRDAEKEVEELRFAAQESADHLEKLLADFKSGDLTVVRMKERMENAEDLMRRYRAESEADRAELLALRKRKGIDCNLFAHRSEVLTILNTFVGCTPEQAPRLKERAKEVLGKVYAK